MNEIKVTVNYTNNTNSESCFYVILKWLSDASDVKICRGSLVFIYESGYGDVYVQYEAVEIEPEMTPEQLYNYWRLMNE